MLRRGPQPLFLTLVEVEFEDGGREHYFLPLTVCTSGDAHGLEERAPQAVLATVTGARKGVLFDAWLDDRFAPTLLDALGAPGADADAARRDPRAPRQPPSPSCAGPSRLRVTRPGTEQSNTSLIFGDRLIMKLFRRIEPGSIPTSRSAGT